MGAAYPKPDGQKINHHAPKFDWTTLPASGRKGPAPKLPSSRPWTKSTRDAWRRLWAKPQAVAWDQTGDTLHRWAVCHHEIETAEISGRPQAPFMAEMRQIEDRHGLNPKAMLQLRWRIVDDEGVVVPEPPAPSAGRRPARHRLVVVD